MASLNARSGVLGRRLAHHLLSRVTYNITPSRIDYFATRTATQAINELFNPTGSPPLYPDGPLDATGVKVFSDSDYLHQPGRSYNGGNRRRAIESWRCYEAMGCTTAKWKVIHYFASIFSVFTQGIIYQYHFWRLLEKTAFTDIKNFALKVTYDQVMLRYLNNNVNIASAPNENFARELLELFTILKGPQIATGNYTTYTEADISQAARVLTGIRTVTPNDTAPTTSIANPSHPNHATTSGLIDPDTGLPRGYNQAGSRHDSGNKTFSAAFQNYTVVGQNTVAGMDAEVADFVDMVFNQLATAKSYVRKMYHFFVNDQISTEVENDIITPLANQLLSSGYDHIAVMKVLFKSVHFFDEDDTNSNDEIIGAKIKSPHELMLTTKNQVEAEYQRNSTSSTYYDELFRIDWNTICAYGLTQSGLDTRGPVTVEGFPGWNDDARSKHWFSTNYVYNRFTYGLSFRRGRLRNSNTFFAYKTDMVAWVKRNIDVAGGPGTPQAPVGAADANLLINKMLGYLLVEVPVGDRLCYFQKQLLGGLSTINWYTAWSDYLTTGVDTEVRLGIERLYDSIMSSPEFQTF